MTKAVVERVSRFQHLIYLISCLLETWMGAISSASRIMSKKGKRTRERERVKDLRGPLYFSSVLKKKNPW